MESRELWGPAFIRCYTFRPISRNASNKTAISRICPLLPFHLLPHQSHKKRQEKITPTHPMSDLSPRELLHERAQRKLMVTTAQVCCSSLLSFSLSLSLCPPHCFYISHSHPPFLISPFFPPFLFSSSIFPPGRVR